MNAIPVLTIVFALLAAAVLAFAVIRTVSLVRYNQKRRQRNRKPIKGQNIWIALLYGTAVLLVIPALLFSGLFAKKQEQEAQQPVIPDVTEPTVVYEPHMTAASNPANWGINWEIISDGQIVTSFDRQEEISFGDPEKYFALPGIATFRGNNYRNGGVYGTAQISDQTITRQWDVESGRLEGTNWTGSGWTGQPLIVRWDEAVKKHMNIYPEKKADPDLVEVIYATLDGNIYFLDLRDGSYTRDPINVGMCFKGAGSLDPRGYPLMYVGSGDTDSNGKRPRMFIISLIDGTILYEYGDQDPMALREDNSAWCAFDSSPLVHEGTDTLIWPGENGILYTMTLNTVYDKENGTISVAPDHMVCARYTVARSTESEYWYGMEASAVMVENYLYVSENGGMFYCVDINTMELVWAQDTKDDSNSSPVFEKNGEDGGYLYTAPSLHWTQDADAKGTVSIYKLDAITGEILWERPYDVYTVPGVSGGVQATGVLGKPGTDLEDLVIYPIARTPDIESGILVALNKYTGEEVWRKDMIKYAWSSPIAVYTQEGKGYLVTFDAEGRGYLLEGATGETLDEISMYGFVEATPAVYENMLVVGTRDQSIQGLKIQ